MDDDSTRTRKRHYGDKEPKDRSSKSKGSKRHRRDDDEDDHKRHKDRRTKDKQPGVKVVDDDEDGQEVWVEKNIDQDAEMVKAQDIPTAESLYLTSHSAPSYAPPPLPPPAAAESKLQRDDWMMLNEHAPPSVSSPGPSRPRPARIVDDESLTEDYGEAETSRRTLGGGVDFFGSLGTEKKKKQREDRPDPEKMPVSSRELNIQLKEGKSSDNYPAHALPKPTTPGGPGSHWRMMKLKRVYETAEEEGRTVEEVALERYDSIEAFNEAREERQLLDDREARKFGRRSDAGTSHSERREREGGQERWMFSDIGEGSRPSSRTSFRRPGGPDDSAPSTPQQSRTSAPLPSTGPPANKRLETLRLSRNSSSPQMSNPSTPIPTVLTPPVGGGTRPRALSPSSLNKLQARVLRAKLMNAPDADKLEKQYAEEAEKAQNASNHGLSTKEGERVEVLPTLDGRGKLYDVGQGREDPALLPGNRRKKEKVETRDPKTGELLRYNADDDSITLGDMLRQERFGGGSADQKNLDAELAGAIMGDGKFENDLEYMDDNAERLGRKKMRTDAMKRQFAIQDYAKTQKALASCPYCYGEDDSLPKVAIIAMATRVYLACTLFEELVEGHCYIVPIQHHLSMLEADDDVWDEVRNFMKCLIRMFSEQNLAVIFYETVISLKSQRHTVIECVPVPSALFENMPAYFKESILASETEWTQHKKLINFSSRPGGFRRAMVPNLPYFMVQFDHKGENGYGHVIEGVGGGTGAGEEDGPDEGEKGEQFPRYFAAEIIGNVLELEPRKWRRPKKVDFRQNKERADKFRKQYNKYDWTSMIERS